MGNTHTAVHILHTHSHVSFHIHVLTRLTFPKSPFYFAISEKSRSFDRLFKFANLSVAHVREGFYHEPVDKTPQPTALATAKSVIIGVSRTETKSQCYEFRICSIFILVIRISNGILASRAFDNLKDKWCDKLVTSEKKIETAHLKLEAAFRGEAEERHPVLSALILRGGFVPQTDRLTDSSRLVNRPHYTCGVPTRLNSTNFDRATFTTHTHHLHFNARMRWLRALLWRPLVDVSGRQSYCYFFRGVS